jgi:hypothetical protein
MDGFEIIKQLMGIKSHWGLPAQYRGIVDQRLQQATASKQLGSEPRGEKKLRMNQS